LFRVLEFRLQALPETSSEDGSGHGEAGNPQLTLHSFIMPIYQLEET